METTSKLNLTNLEKLEHALNIFSKRILPAYLYNVNPGLFLEWQGNACKQTAVLSTFIIKHYMDDQYDRVEAYEGFFEHENLGSYNHCWNYMVHKWDPEKNIICDFTSSITYMDYCKYNNPTLHIRQNDQAVVQHYSNIKMIGYEKIDVEKHLTKDNEFYTGRPGYYLIKDLIILMRHAKLL